MNENLVHQQLSLTSCHTFNILCIKSLHVLSALLSFGHILRAMLEYKAGEGVPGYSRLIN